MTRVKQLSSSSDGSSNSASSLNPQIPLLPNLSERQRLPSSSLLNHRSYIKSRSIYPSPMSLIKKHWIYAKELFHRRSNTGTKMADTLKSTQVERGLWSTNGQGCPTWEMGFDQTNILSGRSFPGSFSPSFQSLPTFTFCVLPSCNLFLV